jgi:hypothetical protein
VDVTSHRSPFRQSEVDIAIRSLVINHIEEATQGKNTALAYVYCHYKDEKTTSEIELLSSIIRQVAEQTSPLPLEIVAFRDAHLRRKPTNDEWISLLISIRHLFDTIFVCIDALVRALALPPTSYRSRNNAAI